jgi:hypothetical protein
VTVAQIVKETRKLPREQRTALADRISLDLNQEVAPEIEQAWGEVAARRLAELDSGKVKPMPGHEVMARARIIIQG